MQVASFGILCCYPFCVTCHILLDTMKFSFHCSLYLYVCGCGCGSTIYVFCIFNSNCSECIRVLCIAPVCSFSNVLSTLGQCSSKFWSFFFLSPSLFISMHRIAILSIFVFRIGSARAKVESPSHRPFLAVFSMYMHSRNPIIRFETHPRCIG